MAVNHLGALPVASVDSVKTGRSDLREMSRVSIIAFSFHVFMGTCAIAVGATWIDILTSSTEGYTDLPRFHAFAIFTTNVVGIYLGNLLAPKFGVSEYQLAVVRVWLLFAYFSVVMFAAFYLVGWHTNGAIAAIFSGILTSILYSARMAYLSLSWFALLALAGLLTNPTLESIDSLVAAPLSVSWSISASLIIPLSVAATIIYVIDRLLTAYELNQAQLIDGSKKLEALASTDPLTGFASRAALEREFEDHRKVANSAQKKILVALIDVDNFKGINTFFGHSVGDDALKFVAHHAQTVLPDPSHVRLGGDEFLLIMTSNHNDAAIASQLRRITHEVEFKFGEQSIPVSMSLGYSTSSASDAPLSKLIAEADLAMRKAKRLGKSITLGYVKGESVPQAFEGVLPGGMNLAVTDTKSKSEIPTATVGAAILDDQIDFALQPIMDARTGEIIAAEALLRWYLDDGSLVPLQDFLSTFILLEWQPPYYQSLAKTRFKILDKIREIRKIDVHFNFSIESLVQAGTATRVPKLKDIVRSDLAGFVVEVSERDSSYAFENGIPHQDWVLSRGGKYALDDFGKGLSNFDRLTQLKIDMVKFDSSLIQGIQNSSRQRAAIRHVTALCEELNISFIAEGVETIEQESALLELGVFAHQGFLRGKPMKKSEFFALLRSNVRIARPRISTDSQNLGEIGEATFELSQ